MGYQRSDNRYGDDRWRDERGRYRDRGDYDRDDGRGFFERAGDELRSWFGDEEAERRRERERATRRDNGWGESAGGGWGNQRGESWHRDRPGESYAGSPSRPDETWGGSGFGGDFERGRRFDRIDAGSTGTHGAHPMSSPVGGAYGAGYGSSARAAAARGGLHDPHYSEWRSRQIDEFDRDYDEYRREHQSKFEKEFGDWRSKRQGQRALLARVSEHMEVVGSDGEAVGAVDKVRGDRIILTRGEAGVGGLHHSIPCGWIETVEDKVTLGRTAREARDAWRDEEQGRALFEREHQGGEGPHMLGRSFAGTYRDRDD